LGEVDRAIKSMVIPAPREVDLAPLQSRLDQVEEAVKSIAIPAPREVDLAPLQARIGQLEQAVRSIAIPAPQQVDLGALTARLQALERLVQDIHIPTPSIVDLAPLQRRLDELDRAVQGIRFPEQRDVDLKPVHDRLAALDAAVQAIHIPAQVDLSGVQGRLNAVDEALRNLRGAPPPIDLAPTQRRLDAIEQAVRSISIPPAQTVDLGPVLQKLAALEARTGQAVAAPATASSNPVIRSGSRNLLTGAAYGKPDDLKQIKGVATVLEGMLHNIGVYYFWQIAEWSAADVAHANDQLAAFKGRITRDQWVQQAAALTRAPTAARRPSGF
jgi:predicted flap endonuclease-1-like 5' DNA nuclease